MEKEIKRVIEIEDEAQSLVVQGRTQAKKIRISTLEEIKIMETKIEKMAELKISQLKEENHKDAAQRISEIREKTVIRMQKLEETINKNRGLWEKQIYDRILER